MINDDREKKGYVKSIKRIGDTKDAELLISFIIPTYLRNDTLIETLSSVFSLKRLDEVNYEVIVIDNSGDLSDDNKTYKIIKEMYSNKVLYYVNEQNLGMEGNWNRAAELARGKYISYLHDDDLLDRDYLEVILKCIYSISPEDKLGFIKSSHRIFFTGKELPHLKKVDKLIYPATILESIITGSGHTSTPTCGIIFNRNVLLSVGGFDAKMYPVSDCEIGSRIIEKGYKGYKTCSELGYYRIGLNESMKLVTIKNFVRMKVVARMKTYKMVWYGRIFSWIFEPVIYTESIDFWIKYAKDKFAQQISITDLDCKLDYKNRPIRKKLLIIINKLYRVIVFKEPIKGRKAKNLFD